MWGKGPQAFPTESPERLPRESCFLHWQSAGCTGSGSAHETKFEFEGSTFKWLNGGR